MGIEPTLSAWEAEVLPLNYARGGLHFSWNLSRTTSAQPSEISGGCALRLSDRAISRETTQHLSTKRHGPHPVA